jgi:hypothetical protein
MWFILDLTPTQEVAELLPYLVERRKKRALVKSMRSSILNRIPEVKPIPLWISTTIFGALAFVGLSFGLTLATYTFFGLATLIGLVSLAESNKYVRWLITKSSRTVDLLIFGATIYATAALGITVVASLTFAGIGYSLVYAPWLRQREELKKYNLTLNE